MKFSTKKVESGEADSRPLPLMDCQLLYFSIPQKALCTQMGIPVYISKLPLPPLHLSSPSGIQINTIQGMDWGRRPIQNLETGIELFLTENSELQVFQCDLKQGTWPRALHRQFSLVAKNLSFKGGHSWRRDKAGVPYNVLGPR